MSDAVSVQSESSAFESNASVVIQRLRNAIRAAVGAVSRVKASRAIDIAEGLDLDYKLAWKIAKVLETPDPFAAAQYVPGGAGFRIFLRAAGRRGDSRAAVASARAAFASFREFAETHAGSRKSFDMMLAGLASDDRQRADLEHRKLMYEASSYIWGVQARTILRLDLLAPSANPIMFDYASVRGFVDLRRLRPNVPWRILRSFSADDAGEPKTSFQRRPLDPAVSYDAGDHELPLMREFCSRPLPECRRVEDGAHGVLEYELVEGAVGNTGILTCITGELLREAEPRYRTDRYHILSQMHRMRTPCEWAVFDLMLHRDLFGRRIDPRLIVYSDLFAAQFVPRYRECDILPVPERVEYLGMGMERMTVAGLPRYRELAQAALDGAGWKADEFDVFRVQMHYPPMPANIVLQQEWPENPEAADGAT